MTNPAEAAELRAAAERVINTQELTDDNTCELFNLATLLARHVLAEHQADDGEAITAAYLLSIGFRQYEGSTLLQFGDAIEVTAGLRQWYVGEWLQRLPHPLVPKTRGDLRQLCRLLGVELKGH